MERNKYIGGSDAAGVVGVSRWDTPLSVWAEKTGEYIKPEVENEAAELGKELEDYVARRFERKTGKRVVRSGGTLFHKTYDFLGANVDRFVEGEDAGLECKTCSAWKSKEWEGEEIPQEYIIQCYHYMAVTGRKKWYIAVLIGNQEFKWKEIPWDDKVIGELVSREVDFWMKFVVPKVMPSIVTYRDTSILDSLFPVAEEGKEVKLTDEENLVIENLQAAKQDLKSVENLIETLENQLKLKVKENEVGYTDKYKVKWANSKWSGFDAKTFKEKYPDLHKEFYKTKITRRFGYAPLKEER